MSGNNPVITAEPGYTTPVDQTPDNSTPPGAPTKTNPEPEPKPQKTNFLEELARKMAAEAKAKEAAAAAAAEAKKAAASAAADEKKKQKVTERANKEAEKKILSDSTLRRLTRAKVVSKLTPKQFNQVLEVTSAKLAFDIDSDKLGLYIDPTVFATYSKDEFQPIEGVTAAQMLRVRDVQLMQKFKDTRSDKAIQDGLKDFIMKNTTDTLRTSDLVVEVIDKMTPDERAAMIAAMDMCTQAQTDLASALFDNAPPTAEGAQPADIKRTLKEAAKTVSQGNALKRAKSAKEKANKKLKATVEEAEETDGGAASTHTPTGGKGAGGPPRPAVSQTVADKESSDEDSDDDSD